MGTSNLSSQPADSNQLTSSNVFGSDFGNAMPLDNILSFIDSFTPRIQASRRNRDRFNIDLISVGFTRRQQRLFRKAANFWEKIIVADLPDISLGDVTLIDDLVIGAIATEIDGDGGTAGQAGPFEDVLRKDSRLPTVGGIEVDLADIKTLEEAELLEDVFLHEIGHVLGIGTLWEEQDLLRGVGSNNPRFLGENATTAFNQIFNRQARSVPVESRGGEGTRDSHWRASIFGSELMIGGITETTAESHFRSFVARPRIWCKSECCRGIFSPLNDLTLNFRLYVSLD